jgi:hypothetical protein
MPAVLQDYNLPIGMPSILINLDTDILKGGNIFLRIASLLSREQFCLNNPLSAPSLIYIKRDNFPDAWGLGWRCLYKCYLTVFLIIL